MYGASAGIDVVIPNTNFHVKYSVTSPEIIAVDELGSGRENLEMLESLFGGVKFIATAHASSCTELKKRKNIEPFFRMGVFDKFVRIFNTDRGFDCEIIDDVSPFSCEEG